MVPKYSNTSLQVMKGYKQFLGWNFCRYIYPTYYISSDVLLLASELNVD